MAKTLIYADYNATSPLCPPARDAVTEAMEKWGNPSSAHQVGRTANELMDRARQLVAKAAKVKPSEVVFTSGGSEANGLALLGSLFAQQTAKDTQKFRLLTSRIEHSSIRDLLLLMEKQGAQVNYVAVLQTGDLDLARFESQVMEYKPHLVSLMTANNETGVLFPIPQVAEICSKAGAVFHTDAVQAFGKVDPPYWNAADLISLSAHKIHGPKGAGALIVRRNRQLIPTHYGGSQEVKRRGGTENVLGIAGFGAAAGALDANEPERLRGLRDRFEARLREGLSHVCVQGCDAPRLPNTTNMRFEGIPSEILLGALDLEGVCVSAGSACSSGSISPSHVLLEMGLDRDAARECLRFSWGRETTGEHIDRVTTLVINHVTRIRNRRASAKQF